MSHNRDLIAELQKKCEELNELREITDKKRLLWRETEKRRLEANDLETSKSIIHQKNFEKIKLILLSTNEIKSSLQQIEGEKDSIDLIWEAIILILEELQKIRLSK